MEEGKSNKGNEGNATNKGNADNKDNEGKVVNMKFNEVEPIPEPVNEADPMEHVYEAIMLAIEDADTSTAIQLLEANSKKLHPAAVEELYTKLNELLHLNWMKSISNDKVSQLQRDASLIGGMSNAKAKANIIEITKYLNDKAGIDKDTKSDIALRPLIDNGVYSLIDFKPRQGYIIMLGFYELSKADIINKKFDLREGNLFVIGFNTADKGIELGDRLAVNIVPNPYLINTGLPKDINSIDTKQLDVLIQSNLKEASKTAAISVIKDLKASPVGEEATPKPILQGIAKHEVIVCILMPLATVMAAKSLYKSDI